MRRTDKEFKEEVLRRSRKYRAEQAKRRRTVLMTAACVLIIAVGVQGFLPHSFKAADNAAQESMKQESASFVSDEEAVESPGAAPMEQADSVIYGEGGAQFQSPAAGEPAGVQITGGDRSVTLDAPDAAVMMGYLDGAWIEAAPNCLPDWEIIVNGMVYRYHSDCGTFRDENGRSLTVSEEDREVIGDILAKYQ